MRNMFIFDELLPKFQEGYHQGWPVMKVKEKALKSNVKDLVLDYMKLV
jgi:hypothetical protein